MIIREAKIDDSLNLFEWKNNELSCYRSKNNKKLTLEGYKIWFQSCLNNFSKKLYI
jgi:hypothetical protein